MNRRVDLVSRIISVANKQDSPMLYLYQKKALAVSNFRYQLAALYRDAERILGSKIR